MIPAIKIRPSLFFLLLCSTVFVDSCNDRVQQPEPANQLANSEVLQYIESLGFAKESIVDYGDYYEVEGDIMFTKKRKGGKRKDSRVDQAYVTTGLVGYEPVSNIRVFVDESIPVGGDDDWRNEVQQAIDDWNSVGGTRLHLTYVTDANADVVVRSDDDAFANTLLAKGEFPSDGLPGYQIRINLDFYGDLILTSDQKRLNMVHELGHTFGMRHTNWQARNESQPYMVPGTPCTDPNSVMNSGSSATSTWNGFSDYDKVAVQVLYTTDKPAGSFYFLRYYNQSTGDHFYTIYSGELGCGGGGYVAEGVEGWIFQNPTDGAVPIYRYWSSTYGDHFYTLTYGIYSTYSYESISGYAYPSQVPGSIPIYMYYNPSLQDHFYTRFYANFTGYDYHGVAWYAIPN